MTNTHNIGVIGTGRLGLSFALLCAQRGYAVYGYDVRQDYIDSLNDKTYTTTEPHINAYLQQTQRAVFTTDLDLTVRQCDILFCFVATPSLPDGSYDHIAIDEVVSDLQELHIKGIQMSDKILVIGCTTMPTYTDTVASRLEDCGISVAYNPEFIAQGDIINGLKTADMILIGTPDESAQHALQGIYRTIMTREPKFNIMSRTAAELTKISINCFLTMKIAYRNVIGEIAINSGVENEVNTILTAIGDDERIGHKYLLYYGFGYGGVCLPRDNKALGIHARSIGLTSMMQDTIDECNNKHAEYLKNYFIQQNVNNLPFIFTQLAYKTGVDILTESQQYRLCKDLLVAGYSVDIRESPGVIEQVEKELSEYSNNITYGTITNGYKIAIYDKR